MYVRAVVTLLSRDNSSLRQIDPSATGTVARSWVGGPRRARCRLRQPNRLELVCDVDRIPVPLRVQRLLALLALHDGLMQRVYVAGKLWLDTTDQQAAANLRSTLWRVHQSSAAMEPACRRARACIDRPSDPRIYR